MPQNGKAVKLHAVRNDTKGKAWCGLAAISAITGVPISVAKERAKTVGMQNRVMGMHNTLLRQTLETFGYRSQVRDDYRSFSIKERPTLAAWLKLPRHPDDILVVNLTGHYVTVKGRKFVDNHTMEPVFIRQAPFRRKRVKVVYHVEN